MLTLVFKPALLFDGKLACQGKERGYQCLETSSPHVAVAAPAVGAPMTSDGLP